MYELETHRFEQPQILHTPEHIESQWAKTQGHDFFSPIKGR
jgi:hypothetical protein